MKKDLETGHTSLLLEDVENPMLYGDSNHTFIPSNGNLNHTLVPNNGVRNTSFSLNNGNHSFITNNGTTSVIHYTSDASRVNGSSNDETTINMTLKRHLKTHYL